MPYNIEDSRYLAAIRAKANSLEFDGKLTAEEYTYLKSEIYSKEAIADFSDRAKTLLKKIEKLFTD